MNELTSDEHRILVDAIHDSATVVHKGQRMNERIKELARQAGCKVMDDGEWYIPSATGLEKIVYTSGVGLEKFAELIVRECIDTAFHKGHPDLEFLLKHFGVEE